MIDVCPQCRGVWLDRGELEKLLELVGRDRADSPTRTDAPRRDEQRYDDRDRRDDTRKRKKRFEIFDFFD